MRLFLILLFLPSLLTGQSSNGSDATAKPFFANVNAGFGMFYGGLGGNLEFGYSHFSLFGAYGYAPEAVEGTIVIESTLNYQFGARYYLDVGSEFFFPRIGLGMGWVTNYYDERIGTAPYDQHVEGLTLHLGMQIYSSEGVVFNFDAGMGSNAAIIRSSSHPHFYAFYIRPCIGIGYDLTRLFEKGGTRRVKNKEINPFD